MGFLPNLIHLQTMTFIKWNDTLRPIGLLAVINTFDLPEIIPVSDTFEVFEIFRLYDTFPRGVDISWCDTFLFPDFLKPKDTLINIGLFVDTDILTFYGFLCKSDTLV